MPVSLYTFSSNSSAFHNSGYQRNDEFVHVYLCHVTFVRFLRGGNGSSPRELDWAQRSLPLCQLTILRKMPPRQQVIFEAPTATKSSKTQDPVTFHRTRFRLFPRIPSDAISPNLRESPRKKKTDSNLKHLFEYPECCFAGPHPSSGVGGRNGR